MPYLFSLLTLLCFIPGCLHAQPVQSIGSLSKPEDVGISSQRLARIDQMIGEYVKTQQIPGAVAYIVRNGKVAYYQVWGTSDMNSNTPLKKDDIFRIASMTKAITSLAVMMLYEEGRFLLDDPLSQYIPEFKNPQVLKTFKAADTSYTSEPANREITIRHLLTHSSGLDYPVIGSEAHKAIYAKHGISPGIGNMKTKLSEEIKLAAKLPLAHHPGEKWCYGLNTDVLGYLVEVISGMPFEGFLQTRIFDKLGMKDTYFTLPKEKHDRLVKLHEGAGKGKLKVVEGTPFGINPDYAKYPTRYPSGGGGLSSTVEDYAKFLQLFLNKGEFNGTRLLGRKTVELMLTDQLHSPIENEFGLGFALETSKNDYSSPLSMGAFSWAGAFNTHYWADPKENLIGILYTNIYNTPHWNIGEKFKVLTYQSIVD